MKKTLSTIAKTFLLLTFFSINNLALAEKTTKHRAVNVISYGIYAHSPDNGKTWINPISDKKIQGTTSSPVHLNSTRTIPAKFPLFFGFEYNINNLDEKIAEVTTEVTHPKIKQADGSYLSHYKHDQKFLVLDRKITATKGYLIENKDEAQAGTWVFKIKLKGKTIITQTFTVTKP